jgi:hypothetical protein
LIDRIGWLVAGTVMGVEDVLLSGNISVVNSVQTK